MIYSKQKDENLITMSLAGDDRAYEELVIRYQKLVISAANSVTRCYHLAEDAAQEAFVSAWIKLNMLREPSKYCSRVCSIARNCAKNSIVKFREYIGLENCESYSDEYECVEDIVLRNDESERLHISVNRLPEKVRIIIHLYYFEGLSIGDIAERMSMPVGTVKYQLHTGRKLIRKDYGDMYDTVDKTLVERVMKSVEQLKLWGLKYNKNGFSEEYERVLAEVEALPESVDKNCALADVLKNGYWWLPGEKNDALLERINNAAVAGKNEEVLCFLVDKEAGKVNREERVKFTIEKQIPRMEVLGFKTVVGYLWFWVGVSYCEENNIEEGKKAFENARKNLKPSNRYYNYIAPELWIQDNKPKKKGERSAVICNELREIDGHIYSFHSYNTKELWQSSLCLYSSFDDIFENIWRSDNLIYDSTMKVGDVFIGSDKDSKREFVADNESVNTPCGIFENCEHWYFTNSAREARDNKHIWYKKGVGIVKISEYLSGQDITVILNSYKISGGNGVFPLAIGNKWSYTREGFNGEYENNVEVTYCDEEKAIVTQHHKITELPYDENKWEDMIFAFRREYWNPRDGRLNDVSRYISRAETLAYTEYEKSYTRLAADVMRRILSTDKNINQNPEYQNK